MTYRADVTFLRPKQGESSGGWSGNLFGLVLLVLRYSSRADIKIISNRKVGE